MNHSGHKLGLRVRAILTRIRYCWDFHAFVIFWRVDRTNLAATEAEFYARTSKLEIITRGTRTPLGAEGHFSGHTGP
jgi:hypothetical protein